LIAFYKYKINVPYFSLIWIQFGYFIILNKDIDILSFLWAAANGIPTTPLTQVREQIVNHCINILGSYRKFCASISSAGQLILPEALKLLPLYTLGSYCHVSLIIY
jgi:Sec23/Sec24 helical domain